MPVPVLLFLHERLYIKYITFICVVFVINHKYTGTSIVIFRIEHIFIMFVGIFPCLYCFRCISIARCNIFCHCFISFRIQRKASVGIRSFVRKKILALIRSQSCSILKSGIVINHVKIILLPVLVKKFHELIG